MYHELIVENARVYSPSLRPNQRQRGSSGSETKFAAAAAVSRERELLFLLVCLCAGIYIETTYCALHKLRSTCIQEVSQVVYVRVECVLLLHTLLCMIGAVAI